MASRLRVVPVTITAARAYVDKHHSHLWANDRLMLACGVETEEGGLVCVAIAEWPKGRGLNGKAIEVSRVASDGSTEHAASKAIAALARGAIALGWRRLVSSTIVGEVGTSYRAAGWRVTGIIRGRDWSCPSRPREAPAQPGDKARWEFGPDALPMDADADAKVRAAVGKVAIPPRPPRKSDTPLFDRARREGAA